jgi:GTP cyclohydrolase I
MSNIHRLRPSRLANEAVDEALSGAERAAMVNAAANKLAELLDILRIDHENDRNTRDTPRRVARMLVDEIMQGRFSTPPILTGFENAAGFDQLIVTGPMDIRSTCAHHLMPIYGEAFIAVLPAADSRVIGLSKYDRVVNYFCGRLQMQEELVKQIGQFLMEKTGSLGVAVRISAVHTCKTHRGVRANQRSRMVTSAYFGALETDQNRKNEFLREVALLSPKG